MRKSDDMIKVVLAGQYPEGTYEAVRKLLPETEFSLAAVDTQEAYDFDDRCTDYDSAYF